MNITRISLILFVFFFHNLLLSFEFQNGDILFQEGHSSNFEEAIKGVTYSLDSYNFTHCGICYIDETGTGFVIEALPEPGVVITPIDVFINRYLDSSNRPKVVVGRLVDSIHYILNSAVNKAKEYVGQDYDFVFDLNNESIYCSELIYFSFLDFHSEPIFEITPMTFVIPDTKQIHKN